jgi:hypothetical protein
VIEVLADEEGDQPMATEEPTISLHALTGIQPHSRKMMQLLVTINDANLTALLDSRSTNNFIDLAAAQRARVQWQPSAGLHVVVVNGDHLMSLDCCRGLHIIVGTESFIIDYYGLDIASYEMVLGIQWQSLDPILWDLIGARWPSCGMATRCFGRRQTWHQSCHTCSR